MIMESDKSYESQTCESVMEIEPTCANCGCFQEVPFIRCAACSPQITICSSCFAMGAEFGNHENDHPYSVVKYNFSIYEDKWTASEELKLLDAIMENGFGNWPSISNCVRTKTAVECRNHYLKHYIDSPKSPLPEFPDNHLIDGGAPIIFKLCDNPPRPLEGSSLWHDMGGYSAARGDFNVEFDNFVEMDICHMTFSDTDDDESNSDMDEQEEEGKKQHNEEEKNKEKELYERMKYAVIEIYRNAIKERQWRKSIVRDYGLINLKKWYGMFKRRYERNISLEFFRPFMRLFPPMTFDKHLESLLYEKLLKTDISRLQDYRKHGLKRLGSIRTFHLLRQRREATKSKRHLLQDVLNHIKDESSAQTWLARQAAIENTSNTKNGTFPLPRRPTPRLNIEGLPGFEKLNQAERVMCSEVRLIPEAYLEFSKILINECGKHGSLRLAQARPLIKIDVNKTRKLYDFLILHGHINKEPV